MESKKQKITCSIHKTDRIERISSDPNVDKLFCIECVVECSKAVRESLTPLKGFIEKVDGLLSKQETAKLKKGIPDELTNVLKDCDSNIAKLSETVNGQKETVSKIFDKLEVAAVEKIRAMKQNYLNEWDKVIDNTKINIDTFKQTLDKFFTTQTPEETPKSLQSQVDECQNLEELQKLITRVKVEVEDLLILEKITQDESTLISNLKKMKDQLTQSFAEHPTMPSLSGALEKDLPKVLQDRIDRVLSPYFDFVGNVPRISLSTLEGTIMLTGSDKAFIKTTSNTPINIGERIYSGTKDGYVMNNIIKKGFPNNNVLMVLTTKAGETLAHLITAQNQTYSFNLKSRISHSQSGRVPTCQNNIVEQCQLSTKLKLCNAGNFNSCAHSLTTDSKSVKFIIKDLEIYKLQ